MKYFRIGNVSGMIHLVRIKAVQNDALYASSLEKNAKNQQNILHIFLRTPCMCVLVGQPPTPPFNILCTKPSAIADSAPIMGRHFRAAMGTLDDPPNTQKLVENC